MAKRSEVFVPIGLVLTLGCGLLHAQPAGREGLKADVPRGQNEVQPAPPVLIEPRSLAGMNLDYTRGAKLGEVFQDLSKHSGVSIILHASVAAQEFSTSADLRAMSFQRALDTLLLQNNLFYKVLDPNSIMVFKKTPQNLQEFENKSIKTFYLSNAEVEVVRSTFNSLMPQLRVFIDKRLNAVTIQGNPSELANAQQVVNNLDRTRGEVRLQMELIEVGQKASVAAGLLSMIGTTPSRDTKAVAPDQALAKVMQDGDGKLLASPTMRVVSGETSEIRIGGKPALIPEATGAKTTKSASTGRPGGTGQAPQSEGLGVRIKVKPRLHPDHEITLELEYESTEPLHADDPGRSSLRERVIRTTVRLKDGEIAVFGGLLLDEERESAAGGAGGGKEKKDRVLLVKAMAERWGDQ
jgi:general secretion pathway protein D